jgi:hypothetical protein
MNERYNLEKAQEEASVLKKKVDSKEATGYSHAEDLVEHEKEQLEQARENAKNGTTAQEIRELDLSTLEGRNKLRELLAPWDYTQKEKGEYIDDQKILLSDGKELLPFDKSFYITEQWLVSKTLTIEALLIEYKSRNNLEDKLDIVGHALVKALLEFSDVFGLNDSSFESMDDSDSKLFIGTLKTSGVIAAQSLNSSLCGGALGTLLLRAPEETAEKHPNYHSLKMLIDTVEKFFEVWNESFYEYLSSLIQNQNYSLEGGWDKTFLTDNRLKARLSASDGRITGPIYKKIAEGEFSQEVEDQALFLIDKIKQYQTILEESCKKMGYAKPKEIEDTTKK